MRKLSYPSSRLLAGFIILVALLAVAVSAARPGSPPEGNGGLTAQVALKEPNVLFRKVTAYPIAGALRDVAVDSARKRLYLSNSEYNYVLVFSLESLKFTQSIRVGSAPWGLDVTKDGKRLVVCNSGGENLSILDVTGQTPAVVKSVEIRSESDRSNNFPHKIVMAANGKGIFSVTNNTSGASWGGGGVRELSLRRMKTRGINARVSSHEMYLGASFDRSWVILGEGDNSGGGVALYSAQEDGYSKDRSTEIFLSDVAANADGTKFIAQGGSVSKILARSLSMLGSVKADGTLRGIAFNPVKKDIAYRGNVTQGTVEVLDTEASLVSAVIPLPEGMEVHRIEVDDGGKTLFCLTDKGLCVVELDTPGTIPGGFRKKDSGAQAGAPGADDFPAPEKLGRIKSQGALWTVRNLTGYALTVQFEQGGAGGSSRTVPYGRSVEIEMKPGRFFVTAKVDSPNVRPFSGQETFETGWHYGSIFYIVPAGR